MSSKKVQLTVLRALITVQAAAVFSASITAGLMMSTTWGHSFHSASSYTIFVVAVLQLVAAILVRRTGGPSQPIGFSAGFLAATLAQVFLGIAHLKPLHVPLGVLLFGGIVFQLLWIRTHGRTRVPAAA